jgi:hypothetical protein
VAINQCIVFCPSLPPLPSLLSCCLHRLYLCSAPPVPCRAVGRWWLGSLSSYKQSKNAFLSSRIADTQTVTSTDLTSPGRGETIFCETALDL